MLVDNLAHTVRAYAPWFLLASLLLRLLHNKFGQGLNHIPGPRLASFSDIWRLWVVWGRRPETVHLALHAKYGRLVRIGPRTVLVGDSDAVKTIYALNAGFVKSGFYPVQMTVAKGRELHSMFNTTDEVFHAKLRRAVSNSYAMSTLVKFEPLVDSTSTVFLRQLEERFADRSTEDGICDFGTWLQYYAFDVIGELTFSARLGFVERGVDVDHIIGDLEWLLNYVSVIGQMPFLDRFLLKNPIRMLMSKYELFNATSSVAVFARTRMAERALSKQANDKAGSRDFLSRFLEAHEKDPVFISEQRVLALTVANMFAGSDTTAITLRAAFYHLLQNPTCMRKLLDEIDALGGESDLVSWKDAQSLPYLGAVIKEALRVHPAVGLPLERVVPERGITVRDTFIPAGTIVGVSAWVVHQDKAVFGQDAAVFRPERWLEADSAQQTIMNNALFSFGAGARTCIGKNISLLEMHKLVPAVLRAFELELVDPHKPWRLHNAWFVKQDQFRVRLKARRRVHD